MSEIKILSVEDNELNQFVLKRCLRDYKIDSASTADEGLRKASEECYDLILMDINLGPNQMDGVELMKAIKALNQEKCATFFALTAYARSDDERRFLKEGFKLYFSKPIDFEHLKEEIEKIAKSMMV